MRNITCAALSAFGSGRLVSLVIPLVIAGCGQKPAEQASQPPRPVIVMRVVNADVFAGRVIPGQARSANEAALSFRVGGCILERRVKTGDEVKEGDIVATIDPAPYQAEVDTVNA